MPADESTSLKYAEACYLYAHYSECVSVCEKLVKIMSTQEDINRMKYLLGKANFRMYQKLKFLLEKQRRLELQHTQEYQELHLKCYQLVKSTIGLLGTALDNGFLNTDKKEDLKMLDMAMLDYITQAKGDCGRCLLCHQKQKLRKSHYFPKALLEAFSKGASRPLDRKIFRHSHDYYGPSKSARELHYQMFCSNCENIFSKHGETQFHPQFFLKIYDELNPKQPTASQDIEYGEWLYQFCIGLIFRGLAVNHSDKYINSDEVYNLFHKCRELLRHINPQIFPHIESSSPDNIRVAILMNPSEALDEDSHMHPSMSKVLSSEIMKYMDIQCALDNDVISHPHQLHAFLVHFGMINVLVSVKPGELTNVSNEYMINPKGGNFPVPADDKRRAKLPKGIWKSFQIEAIGCEENFLQLPDRVARDFRSKKIQQPSEVHQTLYPILKSQMKAAEALAHVKPSPFPEAVKTANFLPDMFIIRPSHAPSSVSLPSGHRILVHRNYNLGEGIGNTLFLAVGNDEQHPLDKPYVLYHHYEPGLQLHYGSFVSPFNLEAQESLLDRKPKTMLKGIEFDIVENFRSVCRIKLPQILGEKGITNCMSLLKRIQSHSCRQR